MAEDGDRQAEISDLRSVCAITGCSRPLLVHNIGAGARLEDTLFAFDLTGHYRLKPAG
jgi:uncharacterized protein YijF (DUF1287 family)